MGQASNMMLGIKSASSILMSPTYQNPWLFTQFLQTIDHSPCDWVDQGLQVQCLLNAYCFAPNKAEKS